MKKMLILACAVIFASGCATEMKKSFSLVVEPADADIKVVPGNDQPEQKHRSPAQITVMVPEDPVLAARGRIEIRRDAYKPKDISLRDVRDGDALNLKLEKIIHYLIKYRLLSPVQSDMIGFRDKVVSVVFTITDQNFQMKLENLTQYPLKILWDRAEYTDVNRRPHKLMHSGIRPQDRNNLIPPQTVAAKGMVEEAVMPISSVVFNREKKAYENHLLFPVDRDMATALKGRIFYLFLPVEVDRQIIPYYLRIEIADVVKEQ